MTKIKCDNFMEIATAWAKENGSQYLIDTYGECKFHLFVKKELIEIFVEDEVFKENNDDESDTNTYYMIERILENNGFNSDNISGEDLAHFGDDFISSGMIGIYPLSDMVLV